MSSVSLSQLVSMLELVQIEKIGRSVHSEIWPEEVGAPSKLSGQSLKRNPPSRSIMIPQSMVL